MLIINAMRRIIVTMGNIKNAKLWPCVTHLNVFTSLLSFKTHFKTHSKVSDSYP